MILENLRNNDLKYMIMNVISIDEYTSKIDKDNITIALYVSDRLAIKELKDYIEKYYLSTIKDIEISDTMTDNGNTILFIEIERNKEASSIIYDIMDTIRLVCPNKWKFTFSKKSTPVDLTKDNIEKYIRLESEKNKVEESFYKNVFTLNDKGFVRKYSIVGRVDEKIMLEDIEKSDTLNNRSFSEVYLLEEKFPTHNIITTDNNVFLVNSNEILLVREI